LYSITPKSKGQDAILWVDTKVTFTRLFIGLLLSIAVALPLGLLMGCYEVFEAYFLPPFAFLAKVPAIAVLPIFFVIPWIGTSDRLFTAMILFGIVPTLTQAIFYAAKGDVPEELLFKARTLGATQLECVWDVIWKQIFPKFLEALRLSVGPALIYLFAAEYIKGETGLGGRLRLNGFKGMAATPHTYFYVAYFAVLCFLLDTSLRWLQRKLCPWYGI
jgi:NitT/TauT family transport system permease protein